MFCELLSSKLSGIRLAGIRDTAGRNEYVKELAFLFMQTYV